MEFFKRAARAAFAASAMGALVACGGGGGGDSGSGASNGSGSGGNASPYVMFASDYGSGSIAAFTTLSPAAGSTLAANVVEVVPDAGFSLWYDTAHDDLYTLYSDVFAQVKVKVVVFAHAATLKTSAAPGRTLVLADFGSADTLLLDTANDRLWVSGSDNDAQSLTEVFEHASTLTGTPTASRSMRIDGHAIAIDFGRDILYTNHFANEVEAYSHVSTLSGRVFPDRTITNVNAGLGLTLDASRDILYTAATTSATVTALHGASTATTGPGTTISLPAGATLMNAVVDPGHDRLYVGAQDGAYVIDNVSTLATGSTTAALVQAPNSLVEGFAFAGQ